MTTPGRATSILPRVCILLVVFTCVPAGAVRAQTKDPGASDESVAALRQAAARPYDALLYDIGGYVRGTWKAEGPGTTPRLTARLSNDALATAVNRERDAPYFRDTAAAADPNLLFRIAFENRRALGELVMERLRPALIKALCGKGGVLEELDDLKLKEIIVIVGTALGFATVAGGSVAAVPAVVIAVSALIVKAGVRQYCLGTETPVISSVAVSRSSPTCFQVAVLGAGFTFGSTVLVERLSGGWPTTYVSPVELRTTACWIEGVPEAERPRKSIVNVVTPNRVSSTGYEVTWP